MLAIRKTDKRDGQQLRHIGLLQPDVVPGNRRTHESRVVDFRQQETCSLVSSPNSSGRLFLKV